MNPALLAVTLAIGVFAGMVACLEVGYRLGSCVSGDSAYEGIGVIEASVFALLGLLLGFSFAGGSSRLDTRRQLIVEEANAIGTAYLRLDLLAAQDQLAMRPLFREYVNARLLAYKKVPNMAAAEQEMTRTAQIQQTIWSRAVAASQPDAARLLLPAINQMIDVTTSRKVALYTHLPALILALLVVVALLSGLLAGYSMAKRRSRSWLHMLVCAMVVSVTIFAVIDLDNPRSGFIRLDAADDALVMLRDSIR